VDTSVIRGKEETVRPSRSTDHFFELLAHYRELVLARMCELIPRNRYQRTLYGPMLEYPLREGKGFRPALCLAVCQASGGRIEEALDTAAALEMFHNAFLIHDDIEDFSDNRRGHPTLHQKYGIAIATNVGDGLNMVAMRTLLRNTRTLGLERALTLIFEVERMARESTEGQSIELDWVRFNRPDATVRDYLLMCHKKTCWYTCIAPMRTGALIAKVRPDRLPAFLPFGFKIGAAFQIQDDILNLTAEQRLYGKEIGGDIAEGKRTVMVVHVLHVLRHTSPADAAIVLRIYGKQREQKSADEIEFVLDRMKCHGSIDFARDLAHRLTMSAASSFERRFGWIPDSPYRRFLEEMITYMIDRQL
jgi:geranylgeranyl diphosphate synthase type II